MLAAGIAARRSALQVEQHDHCGRFAGSRADWNEASDTSIRASCANARKLEEHHQKLLA